MPAIEVEVHAYLRDFLRAQDDLDWSHHLTMGRLVARALRLGRSALMQTGSARSYYLSYLTPALLWPEAIVVVAPPLRQQRLANVEIPQLQQWLSSDKPVRTAGDRECWPDFDGLLLVSPQAWLGDRLGSRERFPPGVPTILDCADDLEALARECLRVTLAPEDWQYLSQEYPHSEEVVGGVYKQLTASVLARPANPYGSYRLDRDERDVLRQFFEGAAPAMAPFQEFWQQWHAEGPQFAWAGIDRDRARVWLHVAPVTVAEALRPVWAQQPVVAIGSFLDRDPKAQLYRQDVGLGEVTCVNFAPDRRRDLIRLYLPESIPLPNTPQYRQALIDRLRRLLELDPEPARPTVLIVGDMPLKAQVAATMAAEFGSRVRVERTDLDDNSILVSGWSFWRDCQDVLPTPQVLAIATLPLPSLEDPLVAARVDEYKRQRQDWFRLYLLPEALRQLQRAIAPVRESQGIVALFDNRVNYRSYGKQVLAALEPYARTNDPASVWDF